MKQPLVSVSISTYNHELYIRECLESVVSQKTTFPFEVIIGEDCSTDNTREIVKEFEQKYPDIIKPIYHEQNVGMLRNGFEFCYQACKGNYISSLEGDDYWIDPYKLQKQIDFLETNPAFVCHCHNAKIWENGKITRDFYPAFSSREISRRDIVNNFIIPTASITFKNVLKDNMPDYLMKSGIDVILFFALATHGSFYMSDEFMSVYRIHPGGIWSSQSQRLRDEGVLNLQKYIIKNLPLNENERSDIYNLIIRIRQQRIKRYAQNLHFGFTYFTDIFYLIGAKLKGRSVNLNYLLYLMCPPFITTFLSRVKRKFVSG